MTPGGAPGAGGAPDLWTWRAGPVAPGPSVVVDVDGVLSDAARRQHYLERPRADWRAFFDACGDDEVIDETRVLLDLLDPALRVVLLTARPQRVHPLTEAWLQRYAIRWDLLVMRPDGSFVSSPVYKAAALDGIVGHGFQVRLGIEDDPRNVAMFQQRGIPCLYHHSGYYD